MKKNNKGFTLIELLAVIVILAVILVVTIPTVLSSMDKAKENSLKNAANTVEDWFTKKYELSKISVTMTGAYNTFGGVTNSEKVLTKAILEEAGIADSANNINLAESKVSLRNNKVCVELVAKEDGRFWNNNSNLKFSSGCGLITLSDQIKSSYMNNRTVANNGINYQYDTVNHLMKDTAGNVRYYGANPDNYVYFNCDDYSNQNSTICETWRIIGVFDGKIKLIRSSSIGLFSWDTSASDMNNGYGINEWSQSDLMKLLNPGYESETVGGSLYYNSGSGNCYNGGNNLNQSCSFTSTGLKNEATKNFIADSVWNLYPIGANIGSGYSASELYNMENTSVNTLTSTDGITRTTSWTGKIALSTPSDYGYAVDFEQCNKKLNLYDDASCTSNNWMHSISPNTRWNLSNQYSTNQYKNSVAIDLTTAGKISQSVVVSTKKNILPVLYLKSNVTINSGDGKSNTPYQIIIK